jgi:putative hydrolase of the HAD superfamily
LTRIRTLFLDIGGVLATNGWDVEARRAAADEFDLDFEEFEDRHHLTFDTYESGKISLDEYLRRVVFYDKRRFTPAELKAYIFGRWRTFPDMWGLVKALKERYALKTVAVSNEGREFTARRVRQFRLTEIMDTFVVSGFVGLRKPDYAIYRLALDISQSVPSQTAYVDDRAMLIDVAASLGIHGVLHKDYPTTRDELAELGLELGT